MGSVDYRVIADWSAEDAVRKDIVIGAEHCTREQLIALANHLSLRFVLNPVVVINIFNDERAALSYDKAQDEQQRAFAFAHWPARYVKSRSIGLNQFVIYPACDHSKPEQVDL